MFDRISGGAPPFPKTAMSPATYWHELPMHSPFLAVLASPKAKTGDAPKPVDGAGAPNSPPTSGAGAAVAPKIHPAIGAES